jgi:hypothetical protein
LTSGAKLFQDVVNAFHEPRSIADEAMAAAAGEAVDGARNGEDLAVLLHRVVGRGERPAPRRGLDHDHAER